MQSKDPIFNHSRESIDAWLISEKARLEPRLVGLGHWFHDAKGSGFGVSLTCFFGVSGEFHVSDDGRLTYCLGKYGGDKDEVSVTDQISAWSEVTQRFAEFVEVAERMDESKRNKNG